MFKAKTLIEKMSTKYLKPVPWSPQQTIPDIFTLSYTYSCVRECECVSVSVYVCECVLFVYVSEFVCDGEIC